MATQNIKVVVSSKGAVTVRKQLSDIGESARSTTTYLNSLRAVLAAALTFSGVGQIVEIADQFIVLTNRLRLVATETETVAQSWDRLLQIANESYSTIDGTVNLYFRVAQAYQAWGKSAEEAYEFTDLFQKAAILSGSSMQTTAQAVYQFSQALNKGKLDGDEFRSVMEGLPYVANILQRELGVTRAELYKLSADGKISLDRITGAFEEAAATIRGDFSKITPTIGMAINVLRNNWTDFIGDIQTSTGIFTGVAYAIILVANNFDLLAIALTPVAASLAFLAGKMVLGLVVLGFAEMSKVIRTLIPLVWSLNAAMLANPFVLVAAAIAAVVAGIIYFRNELGLTDEVLNRIWMTATTAFTAILNFLAPIGQAILQIGQWLLEWNTYFIAIHTVAVALFKEIMSGFAGTQSVIASLVAYFKKSLEPLFNDLIALGENFVELMVEIGTVIKDLVIREIEQMMPAFKAVWEFIEPALKMFIKLLTDIVTGWKIIGGYLKNNFFPIVKDVFEGWILIIRSVIETVNILINAFKTAVSWAQKLSGYPGPGAAGKSGKGMNYGGQFYAGEFANGGGFKVPGTNAGRDSTPVAFRANRGERVTVETKKQQRVNDDAANQRTTNVNVPVSVTNVLDPSMVPIAMESASGQRAVVNVIRANRNELMAILGVV